MDQQPLLEKSKMVQRNTLENLAFLATKRPKLSMDNYSHSQPLLNLNSNFIPNPNPNFNGIANITPPPNEILTNTSSTNNTNNNIQNSYSSSSSASYTLQQQQQQQQPPTALGRPKGSLGSMQLPPMSVPQQQQQPSTTPNAKRQRIGPSCDKCRLKKIKCNAKVEIILQDDRIIPLISEKLHYCLMKNDVLNNLPLLVNQLNVPQDVINLLQINNQLRLIKHIDKLILFQPCNSCIKRKAAASTQNYSTTDNGATKNPTLPSFDDTLFCTFSKGFTRADINIFGKISMRLKGRAIKDMTYSDYRRAGF